MIETKVAEVRREFEAEVDRTRTMIMVDVARRGANLALHRHILSTCVAFCVGFALAFFIAISPLVTPRPSAPFPVDFDYIPPPEPSPDR